MANVAVLDGNRHRALRVRPDLRLRPHDGLGVIPVVPAELDAAHKELPVFARKHPDTGQFFLFALLATQENHNRYLDTNGKWRARYLPLFARRGPFLMQADGSELRLCIDLDDPRVGIEGERLFDDSGAPTAYANQAAAIMRALHHGEQDMAQLMNALTAQGLLEPLSIAGETGVEKNAALLRGLYAVNPERLKALDAAALTTLNASGALQQAYFLASSVGNLPIVLSNRSTADTAA